MKELVGKISFGFLVLLVLASISFSQESANKSATCPTLEVIIPDDAVKPGERAIIKAKVEKKGKSKIKYSWTISSGKILKGQGTDTLLVEQPRGGDNLTAIVDVSGFSNACPTLTASGTLMIWHPPPGILATKIDEFDNNENEKPHYDNFVLELKNNSERKGCIIITFSQDQDQVNAFEKMMRGFIYLTKDKKIAKNKLTFSIERGESNITAFWIVPKGAEVPAFGQIMTADEFRAKYKQLVSNQKVKKK